MAEQLYDEGEAFDASDLGEDVVPEGVAAALLAAQLDALHAAGFREAC